MNEEIHRLLKNATDESDSAAYEFESAGEHTYGDVANGLINFHRSLGRAQVSLLRAEIDLLKVRALLHDRPTKAKHPPASSLPVGAVAWCEEGVATKVGDNMWYWQANGVVGQGRMVDKDVDNFLVNDPHANFQV